MPFEHIEAVVFALSSSFFVVEVVVFGLSSDFVVVGAFVVDVTAGAFVVLIKVVGVVVTVVEVFVVDFVDSCSRRQGLIAHTLHLDMRRDFGNMAATHFPPA